MICGGWGVLPGGWPGTGCTWICILVPSIMCIVSISPKAEDYNRTVALVVQLTYIFTMLSSLVFLSLTACSDPGIIPRKPISNILYKKPAGIGTLEKRDEESRNPEQP